MGSESRTKARIIILAYKNVFWTCGYDLKMPYHVKMQKYVWYQDDG